MHMILCMSSSHTNYLVHRVLVGIARKTSDGQHAEVLGSKSHRGVSLAVSSDPTAMESKQQQQQNRLAFGNAPPDWPVAAHVAACDALSGAF